MPIALRLATLRFDRDITQELAAVTSAMEQLSPESDDPWKQAAQFLRQHVLWREDLEAMAR